MDKTVVITENILFEHTQEALNNLNKIQLLSPALMIFAAIYTAEIIDTFFDSKKEK